MKKTLQILTNRASTSQHFYWFESWSCANSQKQLQNYMIFLRSIILSLNVNGVIQNHEDESKEYVKLCMLIFKVIKRFHEGPGPLLWSVIAGPDIKD